MVSFKTVRVNDVRPGQYARVSSPAKGVQGKFRKVIATGSEGHYFFGTLRRLDFQPSKGYEDSMCYQRVATFDVCDDEPILALLRS